MATRYGVNSALQNTARTKGGDRPTSDGANIEHYQDYHTIVLASWANDDVIHFGPFKAGQKILAYESRIVGNATTDAGDDVDVGWLYVDGSGSDPNGFLDAADMSAGNIDVDGLILGANRGIAPLEPGTNDRDWWFTLTIIDATGEAVGPLTLDAWVVNFR